MALMVAATYALLQGEVEQRSLDRPNPRQVEQQVRQF
jgi:hypothetical protein